MSSLTVAKIITSKHEEQGFLSNYNKNKILNYIQWQLARVASIRPKKTFKTTLCYRSIW